MAKDDTEIESSTGPDNTLSEPGGAQDLLERGTSVGRYVVIDFIDAGGMGAIYQAFDPELNRPVALKLLTIITEKGQNPEERETDRNRMLREAQALAQLTHPNVVTVYDVGEYQDSIFIAMEFNHIHFPESAASGRTHFLETEDSDRFSLFKTLR